MKATDDLARVLQGSRVLIDVDEPSIPAQKGENELRGIVRRILSSSGRSGARFHFAVVELDRPIPWEQEGTRLVSIMARHSGHDIVDLATADWIGVNINAEPAWILECDEDDARLDSVVDSKYIGFGMAQLEKT